MKEEYQKKLEAMKKKQAEEDKIRRGASWGWRDVCYVVFGYSMICDMVLEALIVVLICICC